MSSFELDVVDRFFAGTVGEPGNRTFFVQAVAGSTILSFKCEKQQVGALAERITEMLTDLPPVRAAGNVAPTTGGADWICSAALDCAFWRASRMPWTLLAAVSNEI